MRTRESELKNFYIGIIDPAVETRLGEQLEPLGRVILLRELCRQGSEPPFRGRLDVLIVSPCILRGVLHGGWPTLGRFFDQALIMLVVGDDDIRIHRDLFDLADGWIIGETQFNNFENVLELSMVGYQPLVPFENEIPTRIPGSINNIWSLSEIEFGEMTEPGRTHPVDKMEKKHNLSVPINSIAMDKNSKKIKIPNYKDLTKIPLFLQRTTKNEFRKLIKLSNETEFSEFLSRIVRFEFVLLLGIALFFGEGSVAKILQSVVGHEQTQLLIIGCAVTGWLLRMASLKNWLIRAKS